MGNQCFMLPGSEHDEKEDEDPSTMEPVVSMDSNGHQQHTLHATPSCPGIAAGSQELSELKLTIARMQQEYEAKLEEAQQAVQTLKAENDELKASKPSAGNAPTERKGTAISLNDRSSNSSKRYSGGYSGKMSNAVHRVNNISVDLSQKTAQQQDPNLLSPLSDSAVPYQPGTSIKAHPTGSMRSTTTIYEQSSSEEDTAVLFFENQPSSSTANVQISALKDKLNAITKKSTYFENECEKLMMEIQDNNQWKAKYEDLNARFVEIKDQGDGVAAQ